MSGIICASAQDSSEAPQCPDRQCGMTPPASALALVLFMNGDPSQICRQTSEQTNPLYRPAGDASHANRAADSVGANNSSIGILQRPRYKYRVQDHFNAKHEAPHFAEFTLMAVPCNTHTLSTAELTFSTTAPQTAASRSNAGETNRLSFPAARCAEARTSTIRAQLPH